MLSRRVKVISAFIFLVLASLTILQFKKKSNERTHSSSAQQTKMNSSRLKNIAIEPISLKHLKSPPKFAGKDAFNSFPIPNDLPRSCQHLDVIKNILETSVDQLAENIHAFAPDTQLCLTDLGGPSQCFGIPPGSDSDRICGNYILIARSRLVDAITQQEPEESLEKTVIANKIIAKIYNKEERIADEKGTEIFNLADRLVGLGNENPEAHNLRSYFSIQAMKQRFDDTILNKGKESASYLAGSSDEKNYKYGIFYQFSLSMFSFLTTKDSTNLDQAEFYAKEHLAKYPNAAESYHMMAILEGYREHLKNCKEWTKKGLDVGGKNQIGYYDYLAIIKSIDEGTFKKESLGIRIDPSEYFDPEKILQ